ALGEPGATGAGALELRRQPDAQGLDTAGEVRPGGRGDDVVVDLVTRTHTEEPLRGDHERTQVQARLIALRLRRRHPRLVDGDQGLERVDEVLYAQLRQGEAFGGPVDARGVALGAEGPDRTIGVSVALEPFEDLLGVMEHGRR